MKILYLTPGCFDKGGISRYSRYQITALRELAGKQNVSVFSLLGPSGNDFETPFEVAFSAKGAHLPDKVIFSARAMFEAARLEADVVWVAHVHFAPLAHALARAAGRGTKTVANIYGREMWGEPRPLIQRAFKHIDLVMADCFFTADYVESHSLRPKGTTHTIWDCVDLDRFAPGKPSPRTLATYDLPDPATSINLLTLGRIHHSTAYKGYGRLLDVFERLHARCPSLHLTYCGTGDMVEHLKARAASSPARNRIHFTGSVSEADLADVYRSADLFYLVGDRGVDRGEGIPLTPLEAAASGAVVLVGNQDGSREAVDHGITGFALDPFDLEQQASVIEGLVRDNTVRGRLSAAARARSEQLFSYPEFVSKHRELLDLLA